jgi:release factor glutamine methyltransferase
LRAAGCVFAEDETRLLVENSAPADLDALVVRRAAGEPLEHLLGWVEFGGLRLSVGPGVFVPRRRTEFLADLAVAAARPGDVIVELCCGVAAVAAVIADRVEDVEVYGGDIDPAAVACARLNVPDGHLGVGDLYAALPPDIAGRVAVIAANAPYVPSAEIAFMPSEARDHEPLVALDGGADGVELHRRITADAAAWLRPNGRLFIETSRPQASLTSAAARTGGLGADVHTDDDRQAVVIEMYVLIQPCGAGEPEIRS